jgi:hypothetical protein
MAMKIVRLILLGLVSLNSAAIFAQDEPTGHSESAGGADLSATPPAEGTGPELAEETLTAQPESDSALDRSQIYLSTRVDDLAIYLDNFFGNPISDIESADTNLRATIRYDWDDDKGSDVGVRLRGKVELPKISSRLALVFNGEEGDFENGYADNSTGNQDNTAGVQFTGFKREKSRLDYTLGVTSGPSLKPGVRYRYQTSLNDRSRVRALSRLQWEDDEGFYATGQFDYDHLVGDNKIIRWSTKATYGEETPGTEWRSLINFRHYYSEKSAWGFVVGATGFTDAFDEFDEKTGVQLTNAYGAGLRFRNRFLRDWLFVEVQPGYLWRKQFPEDDRHGVFQLRLELEIHLNRGREALTKID